MPRTGRWARPMRAREDALAGLRPRNAAVRVQGNAGRLLWFVAFGLSFVIIGWLAERMHLGSSSPSVFLVPNGLAAGAVARSRDGWRAAYLVATFLGTVAVTLAVGLAPAICVVISAGIVVEAAAFALLARRWPGVGSLGDDVQGAWRFFMAALLAALAGAVVSVPAAAALGWEGSARDLWLPRLGAHLLGLLVLGPLVLLGAAPFRRLGRRGLAELTTLVILLVVTVLIGFVSELAFFAFPYILLAIVLLGVGRLGRPAAMLLPPILVGLVIVETRLDHGPFARLTSESTQQPLAVQLLGITTAVCCWLLACLQGERERAVHDLAEVNVRLEAGVAERTATPARTAHPAQLSADLSHSLTEAALDAERILRTLALNLAQALGDVCLVSGVSDHDGSVRPLAVEATDARLEASATTAWAELGPEAHHAVDPSMSVVASRRAVYDGGGPSAAAALFHPALAPFFESHGLHSALVAPMRAGRDVVGVLTLLRGPTQRSFDEGEAILAQDLADQAGMALANAELHEALRDSEHRFRAAFEDGPVGMAVISLQPGTVGQYTHVNTALCEMTGYPAERLLGRRFLDLTHPEDRSEDTGLPVQPGWPQQDSRDNRLQRADGRWIWVRTSVSVVNAGTAPYAIGHIQDITASKSAEAALAHRALHDPLTGLANRHLLMEHLRSAVLRLARRPGHVAVL